MSQNSDSRDFNTDKMHHIHSVQQNVFLALEVRNEIQPAIGNDHKLFLAGIIENTNMAQETACAESAITLQVSTQKVAGLQRPFHQDFSGSLSEKIERLLLGRDYTVFAGHRHEYSRAIRHGKRYFVLGTTGAASPLRGPGFGEFDHAVWVTMMPDGPRIANLMLDGIENESLDIGAAPEPGE